MSGKKTQNSFCRPSKSVISLGTYVKNAYETPDTKTNERRTLKWPVRKILKVQEGSRSLKKHLQNSLENVGRSQNAISKTHFH